jgi:hypothetical protein
MLYSPVPSPGLSLSTQPWVLTTPAAGQPGILKLPVSL